MLLALLGGVSAQAATITWDGGGGNLSWQTPENWSGNALPQASDDVVINAAGSVTITTISNVTVRSLQCSNSLMVAGGTFRVTAGASVVQGQLATTNNVTLSATGAGTTFTGAGAASVNGASFEATGGARISLPNLTAYSKGSLCHSTSWRASGAGSALDFPGLVSIAGGSCVTLEVQASAGGMVSLANLTTLEEGSVTFIATGTNSLLDLGALAESLGVARAVSFEARNAGIVAMPQFPGGRTVRVTMESGGTLPTAQLRELNGFTVAGAAVDFPALTNLTAGDIAVKSGAVVTAPNLTQHQHGTGCASGTWEVNGAGSVLDLSNLTTLAGPNCSFLSLEATAGGTMLLSQLPVIADGTLYFQATGANSLMDLSALQESPSAIRPLFFEARSGGVITMPQFPGGPNVRVTLESGGVLPVAQLRRLNGFTVTAMAVDFPVLTNLTFGDVTVSGGAVVTVPNLTSHHHGTGCQTDTWKVNGADSVLNLSNLTNLGGPACGYLILDATAGGKLVLSNLPVIADGALYFRATGANSVMDLGALQESPAVLRPLYFEARNDGVISMPQFPGGPTVQVTLESGGVLPVAQFRRLNGFTVTGMNVNFPALTNLTPGDILVSGGAVVTVPNLASHANGTTCFANDWEVRGAGSVLDLSALTNLTGSSCGSLAIEATTGGRMILNQLSALTDGNLSFVADGANSVVDLSALRQSLAATRAVSFEARNAGTILMPNLRGGPTVTVTIKSGGQLSVAEISLLRGLTVSDTTLELPLITNLFSGNLIVSSGAILRLPNLSRHTQDNTCAVSTWEVSGTGSLLDLSALTNLTGSSCGELEIQALAGGRADLSHLATISEGRLSFLADGTTSRVDLDALFASLATSRTVSFEARNAGTLSTPQLSGGPTVAVTVRSNGVMSVAQVTRLGNITVSAAAVNFPALTNFDGGTLVATNGATVTAPSLVTYTQGNACVPDTWLVRDAGSVASFSGLGQLTGGSCAWLDAQALNGGQLLLNNLTNILSGTVHVLSSGTGSVVNLRSLVNFLNPQGLSRLTATNAGVIILNEQPFLLSGVSVNLAVGTPNFPPTVLGPTNLILHGTPWRSYWVDARDAMPPGGAWQFFQRVPLTNEFQTIAPRAAANREFRVTEFTADPFALELTAVPTVGVKVVLYGPADRTFEVQTVTNLAPPVAWQTIHTIAMTNTFRILPTESLTTPQRYFRTIPR